MFAPQLMGIFTADAAVIALGARVLRIEAFAEPMFGASIVASGSMQGAGDSTGCFILNLVSMWGVRLTLAVLLAPCFGLVGVWAAMCAELCTRGVLFLLRMARADGWIRARWRKSTVGREASSSDTTRAIPSPALPPAAAGAHPSGRSSEKLPPNGLSIQSKKPKQPCSCFGFSMPKN